MFKERVKGHHRPNLSKPTMVNPKEFEDFLNTKPLDKNGIIYFHIPFCDNICSFCNLNRKKLEGKLDEYSDFLVKNIKYYAKFPYIKEKVFSSIYFGGGTPTTLSLSNLERVLKAINESFNIAKEAEFSFETTLHNLNKNKINLMQSLGVNRYSIGIQTFSNKGRKLLNRVGDKSKALEKLGLIKDEFNGFVCTDIIYNYPNQSEDEILEDARILKELKIDSTSFYSLQFHEGSAFLKENDPNYYDLKTDFKLHKLFLESMLDDSDYELLEYTKVARKNRDRYLYIKLSHEGVDILPIGVGAGGGLGNFGIFSMSQEMKMISKKTAAQKEYDLFSNLFQYDKIDIARVKSFLDEKTFDEIYKFFKTCESEKLLKIEEGFLIFNIAGIFWGNSIAEESLNLTKEYFLQKHLKEIEGENLWKH